jgi:hypothetical protein
MDQLAMLDRLTIDSVAGVRVNTMTYVRTAKDAASVDCYGRKITFPSHASEAVRFALKNSEFVVRDLPGNLDDQSKVTLVRRLVREGLVVVLSA